MGPSAGGRVPLPGTNSAGHPSTYTINSNIVRRVQDHNHSFQGYDKLILYVLVSFKKNIYFVQKVGDKGFHIYDFLFRGFLTL